MGCSRALCDDCRVFFEGKSICEDCEEKIKAMLNENSNTYTMDEFVAEFINRANTGKKRLEKLMKDEGIDEELKKFKKETNETISEFIQNFEKKPVKQEEKNGYLICEKCNGYYELQPGESLDDFETCECGGKLKNVGTINGAQGSTKRSEFKEHSNSLEIFLLKIISWLRDVLKKYFKV